LLIPSTECAANRPYSFSSKPFTGVPDAVWKKFGVPNVLTNSLWLLIRNTLFAFEARVPVASAVPLESSLFSAVAIKMYGTEAVAAGRKFDSSIIETSTPGLINAMFLFL